MEASTTSSQTTSSESPPKPEGEKKDDKAPASQGAPETYTDFTLPEGLALAPETLTEATKLFRGLNLTQEQAQSLVTFHAEQLKAAAPASQDATYTAMRADWSAKTLADPEIKSHTVDGKTGIDAVKLDIGRALGTLPPTLATEFRAAMDLTGAGDHPAFVKAMLKFSQALGEGRPVSGKNPSPEGQRAPGTAAKPTPAQALYPNHPSSAAG